MEYSTFTFTYDELDVDLSQIEHVLGYGEGDDKAIVDAVLAEILAGKELSPVLRQNTGFSMTFGSYYRITRWN